MTVRSKLFQAKYQVFDCRTKAFRCQLDKAESLSADMLAELNWSKRRELVCFCANTIPLYRKKFKAAGFEPGDLKSEADFTRLPILEKEEIRQFEDELVNPAFEKNRLPVSTTGGTTGTPLRTFNDPRIPLSVMSWRTLRWWGVDPSDNSGYLYRAIPRGMQRVFQDMVLWPTRRSYIAAAEMTEDNMLAFYARLRTTSAKYLVGYVGALDVFAIFLEQKRLQLDGLKAVWTTSAPLPETKRQYLTRIYNCPVYTQYGSCEFYWISAECRRRLGLHIASDIRHVEVVEGDRPVEDGASGDLVVTDLINYAFPLLRYRLGDRGRLLRKSCDCGLPFPLMDYVRGRISDAIHLPDGMMIPGEYWTTIFDEHYDAIKSFQVIQKKDYSLEVLFEPFGDSYWPAIEAVSRTLNKRLCGKVPVEFRRTIVDANEAGKTSYIRSEIKG